MEDNGFNDLLLAIHFGVCLVFSDVRFHLGCHFVLHGADDSRIRRLTFRGGAALWHNTTVG